MSINIKKKSIKIIVAIITIIVLIIIAFVVTAKRKEIKQKEQREQEKTEISSEETNNNNSLELTEEMIEDIIDKIENHNSLERMVKVHIELGGYKTDDGYSPNEIEVEVTNHKQTDKYTYTAYIIINYKDNYNRQYSQATTIEYTVSNEKDETSKKDYTINTKYGF